MKRIDVRNRRRALALTAGLVVLISRPLMGHGDDRLRARLLIEAPKAWAKIAAWAEHIETTSTSRSEREELRDRTDRHLKLSGENVLLILTSIAPDDSASRQDVYCRNTKYSFHLRRRNAELPWLVQRFGRTPDAEIDEIFELLVIKVASQPQISVGDVYFPDVFGKESFAIKEVKSRREGATELVSVEFENTLPHNEKPGRWLSRGTVTLNPNLAWAVQECDVYFEFAGGVTWHFQAKNDLASSEGDIPVVKLQQGRINIEDQPESRFTYVLNDLSARSIPEKEFTLTAFGLSEMSPPSSDVSPETR